MSAGLPVSILTGFLGAGKTTLLNRLLNEAGEASGLRDTAVIVNEWGEVAIDHLLIERVSDGVIELGGGCLCCSVRGELVDTLSDLAERVRTGATPKLKRVVIETTGLADPSGILQALIEHPFLAQRFRLDGVVTLVDAVHGEAGLDEHWEARAQVAVADRIVLSKTDVASAEEVEAVTARVRTLNPRARIVLAQDRPHAALLSAGLVDPQTRRADLWRWLGEAGHGHAHDHHAQDGGPDAPDRGPGNGRHAHASDIGSFSLRHDGAIPFAAIETFLGLLRSVEGRNLLRMKGVVELAEDPSRPLVLHGVRGAVYPPAWLPAWPEGPRGTRLVLIGRNLDEDHARRLFAAVTGRPAIDTPDRAALEDNPLAIAGFGR